MTAPASPSQSTDRIVLPDNVTPEHYDLYLEPDLSSFEFKGKVDIIVHVSKSTSSITLNTRDLSIESASLIFDDRKPLSAKSISYDEKLEQTTFDFSDTLSAQTKATLSIKFTGSINDKLAGFYRSEYKNKEGETKYMAVTQFEATDARRAFPCWDEPNKKATFSVTMRVAKPLIALSNMNVKAKSDSEDGRYTEFVYEKSLKMSTYLVAFIVGEIDYVSARTRNHIEVRVYAPKGYEHQGVFAADTAAKVLDYFADYFDEEYPLPKMDMVAIPDFGSGAMENWGLVTYRMTALLVDESSSLKTKQGVAYVVSHELAHQWFGNLVTMEWWSDLWLNEGFATWVGWLAVDKLFPQWQVWVDFVTGDLQSGLSLDALRSSHPIQVDVRDPADISQIFDSISYSKGASVIRMLESYLGSSDFKTGLRSYLKKHKYGNAKTADLWHSLSQASGKPVETIMSGWTGVMGYPVLTVTEMEVDGALALKIRQDRFLSSGDLTSDDNTHIWHVPLNVAFYTPGSVRSSGQLLSKRETVFPLEFVKSTGFCKLNGNQTGFYRVCYPSSSLTLFGKAIQAGKMSSIEDRIGVVNDAFSLGASGYQSTTVGLDLLQYFTEEKEYAVWFELLGQIGRIRSVWFEEPKSVKEALDRLTVRLLTPIVHKVGYEFNAGESDVTALLRALVISSAGSASSKEVLHELQKQFAGYFSGNSKAIHPDLRGRVFAICVRYGGVSEYESVLQSYRETHVADQKVAALAALTATRDPVLIRRTLDFSLSSEVRPQDIIYIFRSIAQNEAARRLTWEFMKSQWQELYKRYYRGSLSLLSSVVAASTSSFSRFEDAEDIRAFFADLDVSSISRTLNQSLEKIEISAKWLTRDAKAVGAWLDQNA